MEARGLVCIAGAIVVLAGALIFQSVPNFLMAPARGTGEIAFLVALLAVVVMLAGFIILVRELRRRE